jgi:hypothetical protein
MAHQRDPRAGSIANVLKLRFLEIGGDPKGTRIDQCQQLLAFVDIGSRARVDVRKSTAHGCEDFGVAKVQIGKIALEDALVQMPTSSSGW